jgi:thymidylate synthase ThyX
LIKLDRREQLDALREAMGTLPEETQSRQDKLFWDLKNLSVSLVDAPTNPYRAIYEMVTATWGGRDKWRNRWRNASPDGRLTVVKAVLSGQTLGQPRETPKFTFQIQGPTRASFDQFARHRFACIGSVGSRDNSHVDAALIVHPSLRKKYGKRIDQWWKLTKDIYCDIVDEGQSNWQNARALLPMHMEWRWVEAWNLEALRHMCGQRLAFCEQWDTVATAWAIRESVKEHFPLIAAYLRPRCDYAGKCLYSQTYHLSELFSCLFAPCGRHPHASDYYATFNESCTCREEIMELTGIDVPRPQDWSEIVEAAIEKDMHHFESDV